MLIDSGVDTVRDLSCLLPEQVRAVLDPDVLTEPPTAAALRLLASIRDERWQGFVGRYRIDWVGLLAWARQCATGSVLARVEVAASLDGRAEARPNLLLAARQLDEANFAALIDALRIARHGLGVAR